MNKGKLYLIPVPLGTSTLDEILPLSVQERARGLRHFIAENAKTARAFLKLLGTPIPIQEIDIQELDKPDKEKPAKPPTQLLRPLLEGIDVGLVSEAGCPAVADPGSSIVRAAHDLGITVVPLVGPVSLLLALAASGMNGQNFAFVGYLPQSGPERAQRMKELESIALKTGQTQVFIETSYRNAALWQALTQTLQTNTRLAMAAGLTLETSQIHSQPIKQWRQKAAPVDNRTPTVFLIGR